MLLSGAFALLLLIAVAVFYLIPRRERCPGCGAARVDDAPLCACGWMFAGDDDDDDDGMDYGDEPERVDELRGGA